MKNYFVDVIDFWKKSNEPSMQASAYREVSRFCRSMIDKIDQDNSFSDKSYVANLYNNIKYVGEDISTDNLAKKRLEIAGTVVGNDFVDMKIFLRALECASYLANAMPDDVLVEKQHERFADEIMDLDRARIPSA
jgi:hypothetical protein